MPRHDSRRARNVTLAFRFVHEVTRVPSEQIHEKEPRDGSSRRGVIMRLAHIVRNSVSTDILRDQQPN